MNLPIGHILVQRGILTDKQVAQVLEEQVQTGRPFGSVAENLFGVSAAAVEKAWAEQYAQMAERVDPSIVAVDPAAMELITRRQAWQFCLLPLGMQGETLRVCTTESHLLRALNFATRHIASPCYFLLSDPEDLARALQRYFPMAGMSLETLGNPNALRITSEAA